ncbi:hypothetical protein HYX12_02515, partial [Candidatus Woesearchaeota archaeon]|nr:hypothetical protein [Candidatus Woesearchaeota archaeon]
EGFIDSVQNSSDPQIQRFYDDVRREAGRRNLDDTIALGLVAVGFLFDSGK